MALVAMEAAFGGDTVFRRTRSSAIDRDEEVPDRDLGLDPADTEGLARRD